MKTETIVTKARFMSLVCASSIATLNIISNSDCFGQGIVINTYNGITPLTLEATALDGIINALIINQPQNENWNYIPNSSNINISNIFSSAGIGNIINYGLSITSPHQTFTLSEIMWSSATPQSSVSGSFGDQGLTYDSFGIGINYGADNIFGTSDDMYFSNGNANTPVNAIYVLGMASTIDIGDLSIDDALLALSPSYPSTETVTYSLRDVSASTTVNFTANSVDTTPEPSTYLMFGLGISALLLIQSRKNSRNKSYTR